MPTAQTLALRKLFAPFADSDGYFLLCVKDGEIVTDVEEDDDYAEYHIERLTDNFWRIERSDAAELCEFVYQGRIPDREFFVAIMNNQEVPLPEGWDT